MIDSTALPRQRASNGTLLHELQRWHDLMLDREDSIIELKREVTERGGKG